MIHIQRSPRTSAELDRPSSRSSSPANEDPSRPPLEQPVLSHQDQEPPSKRLQEPETGESTMDASQGSAENTKAAAVVESVPKSQSPNLESSPTPPYKEYENERLIFNAKLKPYEGAEKILGCDISKPIRWQHGPYDEVHLFESQAERPWKTTRRLCVGRPLRSGTVSYTVFWLPLFDIRIVLSNDWLIFSWSDCNHDQARRPKDYEEKHDRVYKRSRPNNTLLLRFQEQEDTTKFASVMHSPGTDQAQFQLPKSIQLLAERDVVQPLAFKEGTTLVKGFMIKSRDFSQPSTLRLYLLSQPVDISLETQRSSPISLYTLWIRGVQMPNYISDKRGLHQRNTAIGHCDRVDLEPVEVNLAFGDTTGL